jgi:hypothetical protein
MRIGVVALAGLLFTGVSGCAVPAAVPLAADSGNRQPLAHQLIVKFKVDTLACDLTGIARLAADTGTSIEYVRKMSGGACVIRQSFSSGADSLNQQTILTRHPAVESVERDRVMKAW